MTTSSAYTAGLEDFELDDKQAFVQEVLKKGNSNNDSDRKLAMIILVRMGSLGSEILTQDVLDLIYNLINDKNIEVAALTLDVLYYQSDFLVKKFGKNSEEFLKMEKALTKRFRTIIVEDANNIQDISIHINELARSVMMRYYYALLPYEDYLRKEARYIASTENDGITENDFEKLMISLEPIKSDRYSTARGKRLSIVFEKAKLKTLKDLLDNNHVYLYQKKSSTKELPISYRVLVANLINVLKSRNDFEIIESDYKGLIVGLESEYKELESLGVNIEMMTSFLFSSK